MTSWTIRINGGASKTPEQLGIIVGSMVDSRQSQGIDELSFSTVANYDGTPIMSYGDTFKLYRNGVGWFQGVCTTTPRVADSASEGIDYTVAGPWWYLENTTFMQSYQIFDGYDTSATPPEANYKTQYSPRVVLFTNGGEGISSSNVLSELVTYARTCGISIALGDLPRSTVIPWASQFQDNTIAQLIQTVLRWHPDVIVWWNYSGATPRINFTSRSASVVYNHNLNGDTTNINITPRYDLKPSVVALHYQSTNSNDGVPYKTYTTDAYPSNGNLTAPGAINISIDLRGQNVSRQYQSVRTRSLPDDSTSANSIAQRVFWRRHFPRLADKPFNEATSFTIEDYQKKLAIETDTEDPEDPLLEGGRKLKQSSDADDYQNELLDGSLDDWMNCSATELVVSARVYCNPTVFASLSADDKALFPSGSGSKRYGLLSVTITGTDAVTKNYSRISNYTEGETVPSGLAQRFYQSLSKLQYEGSLTITGDEVEAASIMGRVLNMSNGRSEWSSMRAVIQGVSYSYADGSTSINFGPAEQLAPQDIIEQLRLSRTITYTTEDRANNDDQTSNKTMGAYTVPTKDSQWLTGPANTPWAVSLSLEKNAYTASVSEGLIYSGLLNPERILFDKTKGNTEYEDFEVSVDANDVVCLVYNYATQDPIADSFVKIEAFPGGDDTFAEFEATEDDGEDPPAIIATRYPLAKILDTKKFDEDGNKILAVEQMATTNLAKVIVCVNGEGLETFTPI